MNETFKDQTTRILKNYKKNRSTLDEALAEFDRLFEDINLGNPSALKLIIMSKIRTYHPAKIRNIDNELAEYTGGMKDAGSINWIYALYEASIEHLHKVMLELEAEDKETLRHIGLN